MVVPVLLLVFAVTLAHERGVTVITLVRLVTVEAVARRPIVFLIVKVPLVPVIIGVSVLEAALAVKAVPVFDPSFVSSVGPRRVPPVSMVLALVLLELIWPTAVILSWAPFILI